MGNPTGPRDYARDGLLRVTKLTNEHTTLDKAGSTYDTANRLITTLNSDNQGWLSPPARTPWYTLR